MTEIILITTIIIVAVAAIATATLLTMHHRRKQEIDTQQPLTDTSDKTIVHTLPPTDEDVELALLHDFEHEHTHHDNSDLPEQYGIDRMILLVRDPYWLHTYWELTPAREMDLESRIGAEEYARSRFILRLVAPDHHTHYNTDTGPDATNWYLNPARPDTRFFCELGIIDPSGNYHLLLRSNTVHTPRDTPSDLTDPHWACPEQLWAKMNPWGYRYRGGTSPGWERISFKAHIGASPGHNGTIWDRSG